MCNQMLNRNRETAMFIQAKDKVYLLFGWECIYNIDVAYQKEVLCSFQIKGDNAFLSFL